MAASADLQHRLRGALSVRNRVHHFAAAIRAIAAGKVARIAGLPGRGIGDNAPTAHFHAAKLLHQLR